jgi:hypothetical protein
MTSVLQVKCSGGSCHGGGIGNFALGADEAAAYVDEDPTFNSTCNLQMIDSADAEDSLIYGKVTGDLPSGCGGQMPPGGQLTAAEIDCVGEWLTQFED